MDQRCGSEGAGGRAKVSIITGTAYARRTAVGACSKPRVTKSSTEPASGATTVEHKLEAQEQKGPRMGG